MSERIEELYRHWKDLLAALSRRFGRSGADVENALQEALVGTWKHLDRIQPGAERAYLWTAAFRRALNEVQRTPAGDPLPADLSDESRSAEERLIEQERWAQVDAALSELPDTTRLWLVLHARDHSYKDIAAKFGVPMTTVQSRIHRGITHLRERLGGKR